MGVSEGFEAERLNKNGRVGLLMSLVTVAIYYMINLHRKDEPAA